MNIRNFEWKARCANITAAEAKLKTLHPRYVGEDRQTDTYFEVPQGRLKLREGNIENALIFYRRESLAGAKLSEIILYRHTPDEGLKSILAAIHSVKVVVAKTRRIYFMDNIKFHFDTVDGLGDFIEVEAIDDTGSFELQALQDQCEHFRQFFGINDGDFECDSYSDLFLRKT